MTPDVAPLRPDGMACRATLAAVRRIPTFFPGVRVPRGAGTRRLLATKPRPSNNVTGGWTCRRRRLGPTGGAGRRRRGPYCGLSGPVLNGKRGDVSTRRVVDGYAPRLRGGGGGEEEGYIFLFGGLGSIRRGLRVLPHHRHKVLAFRRAPPRGAARCGWGVVIVVVVGGNEDDRRRRSRVLCRGRGRLALARVVVTLDLHPTASPFVRPGESSKCKIICSCLTNCKKLVKLSFTDSCISCG